MIASLLTGYTKLYTDVFATAGRISMAGLSAAKCNYLAEAIKDSVSNP